MAPWSVSADLLWTLRQGEGIPTVRIVVAVVTVFVLVCFLFFIGRVIVFRRRTHARPRREETNGVDRDYLMYAYLQTQSPAVVRMRRLANADGLSTQELNDAAPVKAFAKATDASGENDDNVCAVCLEEMKIDSKTRRMPCGHEFDARCIEEWVSKANRCPVCNTQIVEEDALQKQRIAVLEGRDPTPQTTRQRRRRARGDHGTFELQSARLFSDQERLQEEGDDDASEERGAAAESSGVRHDASAMPVREIQPLCSGQISDADQAAMNGSSARPAQV